jgi:hypothetical protein
MSGEGTRLHVIWGVHNGGGVGEDRQVLQTLRLRQVTCAHARACVKLSFFPLPGQSRTEQLHQLQPIAMLPASAAT